MNWTYAHNSTNISLLHYLRRYNLLSCETTDDIVTMWKTESIESQQCLLFHLNEWKHEIGRTSTVQNKMFIHLSAIYCETPLFSSIRPFSRRIQPSPRRKRDAPPMPKKWRAAESAEVASSCCRRKFFAAALIIHVSESVWVITPSFEFTMWILQLKCL